MSTDTSGHASPADSPQAIESDIEQTRTQMEHTIGAIQEKLSPQRIVADTTDSILDATKTATDQVMHYAETMTQDIQTVIMQTLNKSPLLGIVGSIGWTIFTRKTTSRSKPMSTNGTTSGYYSANYDATNPITSAARNMHGTVADMANKAQASNLADQAQQQASQVAGQAQQQVKRAGSWLSQTMEENPLLVGALALAAGLAIGLSIPESNQEHKMMGQSRDQLLQRAQTATSDTLQRVQTATQETVQKVQAVAHEAIGAAKTEAHHQGLTPPTQQ